MDIKLKPLVKDLKIPTYAHPGDAGLDLFSRENYVLKPGERHQFNLGFSLEIPASHVGLIWDKGGMANLYGLHSIAGVIDSSYRGEYMVVLINLSDKSYQIEKGDKIAQLLIQSVERASIEIVEKLSGTSRGAGMLGSTGKK